MTVIYTNFSSFDEVVTHYNNTAPTRGEANRGKDIRPIGDRRRKWERIVKISANCYALSDGYHFGDPVFPAWTYNVTGFKPTLKHMEQYAPIVWRRKRDGTEEVTLRNGWGPHAHNSRYAFLYRHSPAGTWFRGRGNSGKHYIQVRDTGKQYYLAKARTTPKPIYDKIVNTVPVTHEDKRRKEWVMAYDDNSAVTFRKTKNGWEHVEGTGRPSPARPTINKVTKAEYKHAIDTFFEWGMTISPLLPLEDRKYSVQQSQALYEHFLSGAYSKWRPPAIPPLQLRKVIADEDHPMRLPLWVEFAAHCTDGVWFSKRQYYTKTVETKEDLQRVRTRYNRFINKTLGFMTK